MTSDAEPPGGAVPGAAASAPAWHALAGDQVADLLQTSVRVGLDQSVAERRLRDVGPNRLAATAGRSAAARFFRQFHNPLIYVLLAAGLVTLALDDYVDAAVILGVVLANAAIGHVQEGKAERALDAVRNLLAAQATAIRGGERRTLDAAALVPGDLVVLEPGDRVPADLRLVRAKNLSLVEAALTGESAPVAKAAEPVATETTLAERFDMVYAGTLVSTGQGLGLVVATAAATEIGRIGTLVGSLPSLATPLTRRLDQFARQVTGLILIVASATFAYGHLVVGMAPGELFLAVVGLAVAAIPEGLPAIVTIVLAIGTRVMARNNAVVRRLPAVESLGSVSVICTDKTGTLTRNEMTVVRLVLASHDVRVTGSGYAPDGGFHRDGVAVDAAASPAVQELAMCAALCNDAQLHRDDVGGWIVAGDPTEGALLTVARKAGLVTDDLPRQWPRLDSIPFESERQFMVTLHHDHHGRHRLYLKGAPERVLALCATQGGGEPLDPGHWERSVVRGASEGERMLALALAPWTKTRAEVGIDDLAPQFRLLGLVGIIDPPRPEAIAAVAHCQQAGIRVKMVTGDHAVTAAAIGRQLGLAADTALSGDVFDQLDDEALRQRALATDVFARATPEHKLRLIRALQASGHQVAMTGDGVNDAPALKAADIGVAMGSKGTDAAREASDLVLTDDNFATIARAVRQGRVVYDNIKKVLMHELPTNGGEAGVILLAILAGLPLPVTAGQILWVNTVTAVTLGIALAFEPPERNVMTLAPRPAGEPLITRLLAMRIALVSAMMVAATFTIFRWELGRGNSLELAHTAAVNTIVVCELFYLFNARHFTRHAFRLETLTGNLTALAVVAGLVVLQLAFTYAPPMQQLFRTAPLDHRSWLFIAALGWLLFLGVELEKLVLRRMGTRRL